MYVFHMAFGHKHLLCIGSRLNFELKLTYTERTSAREDKSVPPSTIHMKNIIQGNLISNLCYCYILCLNFNVILARFHVFDPETIWNIVESVHPCFRREFYREKYRQIQIFTWKKNKRKHNACCAHLNMERSTVVFFCLWQCTTRQNKNRKTNKNVMVESMNVEQRTIHFRFDFIHLFLF